MKEKNIKPKYYLKFKAPSKHLPEMKVSQDGSKVAVFYVVEYKTALATAQSELAIYKISDRALINSLTLTEENLPCLSPAFDLLATNSGKILRIANGREISSFPTDPADLQKTVWSDNGKQLYQAIRSGGTLTHRVYDIKTNKIMASVTSSQGIIYCKPDLTKIALTNKKDGTLIWTIKDGLLQKQTIPKSIIPLFSASMQRAVWVEKLKTIRFYTIGGKKDELEFPDLGEKISGCRLALTGDRLFISLMTAKRQVFTLVINIDPTQILEQHDLGKNPTILGTPYIEPNNQATWYGVQNPFEPCFIKVGHDFLARCQFPDTSLQFTMGDETTRPHWVGKNDLFWIQSHPCTRAEQQDRENDFLAVFQPEV